MYHLIETYEDYLLWWPTGLLWYSMGEDEPWMLQWVGPDCVPEDRDTFTWELENDIVYALLLED